MKLCIADPPYLGRAARWYAPDHRQRGFHGGMVNDYQVNTTTHPDAAEWDDPNRHHRLVVQLDQEYDGWAIAAWATSLPTYLRADPTLRVAVWVKPGAIPGGHRIIRAWEPVLLRLPPRSGKSAAGNVVRDVCTATPEPGHVGAKPRAWTRWVLDLLDYDPETDTVHDLFPGSHAVSRAIDQGVLW